MKLLDSRRLRGPNLQLLGPAAVAEVALDEGEDSDTATRAWREALVRLATALGVDVERVAERAIVRPFPGGICFTVPAPIDILYAATEINEWAIAAASGTAEETFEAARERIAAEIESERRPRLTALEQAAHERGVAFLWDDAIVTLGMAARSRSYAIDELPEPAEVPWAALGAIPVVLVSGTNGKTTATRMIARILREAGRRVGNSSTDGLAVDGKVVEAGDWTGAEAARQLLRRDDIDVAVLETARGGILRRGLAVDRADAALLLNVSADHLGEFGVCDLPTMARAKAVIGHVVQRPGHVVLNADDDHLLALAGSFAAETLLFSLDANNTALAARRAAGGVVMFARDGAIWRAEGTREVRLAAIDRMPITFGGVARYNISNALGAAAIAWSLGIRDDAIVRALEAFDAADNPGRGQVLTLRTGATAIVDFGHNPVALGNVLALGRRLLRDGGRKPELVVATTQAGDRDEAALARHANAIADAEPTRVFVWETPHLRRGRPEGETAAILSRALAARGIEAEIVETESTAVARAVRASVAGDVIVVAPCIDRAGVANVIERARTAS